VDLFRERHWDLVGKAWLWYTISVSLALIGGVVWMVKGLNLGIDFTGGAILKYEFERPLDNAPNGTVGAMTEARKAAAQLGYTKSQVQVADVDWLIVRIGELDGERQRQAQINLKSALEKRLSGTCGAVSEASDVEFVGPVVGEDLKRGARWALILGCGLILVYISARYRFRFAVAAIIALVHDVLILCGVMALLRVELNSPFVAAILTIIGYSINDTVVIFDRIRENMTLHRQAPFDSMVNASLLQTMARSLNTVATTLITLILLFFFGGATIRSFALALVVGIASGCYSSIFNASQLLCTWQRMWHAEAGDRLYWRAILALAPALVIALVLYPLVGTLHLDEIVRAGWQGAFTWKHAARLVLTPGAGLQFVAEFLGPGYWVAVLSWGIGLFLTRYFSTSALRVLAGVPAARGRTVAGRVGALRPDVAAQRRAAAEAALQGGAAGSAEGVMQAASAAAADQAREDRRERRKQRKAKEKRRPGKRKKRF